LCRGKDLKDLKHEIYFLILTVNNEQKHSATKKRIMREGIRNAVTGNVEGGWIYATRQGATGARESERDI